MEMDKYLRKARRSLGTRSTRRRGTNGKTTVENGQNRKAMRRNPIKVKNLTYQIVQKIREMIAREQHGK